MPSRRKAETSKKRHKNRAKAVRREKTRAAKQISVARRHLRADAPVIALRREAAGEIVIGVRRGLFGHPGTVVLRVDDVSIAGIAEDNTELAKFVNNVGLLTVAQLFGHNLAEGLEGLGKAVAKWAGLDLEALAREDAAESESCQVATSSPAQYTCPHCSAPAGSADELRAHFDACPLLPPPTPVEVPSVDDVHPNEAPVL